LVNRKENTVDTGWLGSTRKALTDNGEPEAPPPKNNDYSEIVLRVEGENSPLVFEVTKGGLVLGRADLDERIFPDIDFSFFDAAERGVSRRHARLVLNTSTHEVEIFDMNSTNGTYVNGERLAGKGQRYLNHGDLVRLGKLKFQFYYRN
jgi:pSer/pThr/pTyr-binding forkhead associated (FHA) protein